MKTVTLYKTSVEHKNIPYGVNFLEFEHYENAGAPPHIADYGQGDEFVDYKSITETVRCPVRVFRKGELDINNEYEIKESFIVFDPELEEHFQTLLSEKEYAVSNRWEKKYIELSQSLKGKIGILELTKAGLKSQLTLARNNYIQAENKFCASLGLNALQFVLISFLGCFIYFG